MTKKTKRSFSYKPQMKKMYWLLAPPSWVTASTNRSWRSAVQRRRGFGSEVKTRHGSPLRFWPWPPSPPPWWIWISSWPINPSCAWINRGNIFFPHTHSLSLSLLSLSRAPRNRERKPANRRESKERKSCELSPFRCQWTKTIDNFFYYFLFLFFFVCFSIMGVWLI